MTNRYDSNANYVTAVVQAPQIQQQDIVDVTAVATTPATIYVDSPLQTLDGATEKTTGMDRSLSLVVRLLPFSVVWLVLALGVTWAVSMGAWFTLTFFSGLTSVTYIYLDRQEREYSRNGLERHKVNTIADLKYAEMQHAQELKRMALSAQLKYLGVEHDDY